MEAWWFNVNHLIQQRGTAEIVARRVMNAVCVQALYTWVENVAAVKEMVMKEWPKARTSIQFNQCST